MIKTKKQIVMVLLASLSITVSCAAVALGDTYTQVGNTTYGSDGSIYNQVGNTTYGSDGSVYNQVGNTTYGSNGKICTKVGNSTYCN